MAIICRNPGRLNKFEFTMDQPVVLHCAWVCQNSERVIISYRVVISLVSACDHMGLRIASGSRVTISSHREYPPLTTSPTNPRCSDSFASKASAPSSNHVTVAMGIH